MAKQFAGPNARQKFGASCSKFREKSAARSTFFFFFFSTKIAVLTVFSLNFNVKLNALRQLNEKQGQCRPSQAAEVSV